MSGTLYNKSPITEAVVEFIFSAPVSADEIERRASRMERYYSNIKRTSDIQVMLKLGDDTPVKTNRFPKIELSSVDSTEVLVLRERSVIVSQRAPYRSWIDFASRINRDLGILSGGPSFPKSDRIGMRYINRIDITSPDSIIEESDYLNIFVGHPPGVGPFVEYSLSFSIACDQINGGATVRSGIGDSPLVDHRALLLDIDVFSDREIPQRLDKIGPLLDLMNDRARATFEMCITEKSRSLFSV